MPTLRRLKIFIHLLLLITTPSLFLYSQYPSEDFPVHQIRSKKKLPHNVKHKETYPLVTYDEIIRLLDEVESGKAEKRYRLKDLQRIDRFLAYLAQEGDSSSVVRKDVEELLQDEHLCDIYATFLGEEDDYAIVPAIFEESAEVILCKNWFEKKWKKTRKFVKKHKKAIIIGIIVVVVVVAVTVAVVTSSPNAALAAGSAIGALTPNTLESSRNDSWNPTSYYETPLLDAALGEQISSFKETVAREGFFESQQGLSWEESGKTLGSLFAHESFHALQSEFSTHPQFAQEMEGLQHHFSSLRQETPFHLGHHGIDQKFSTDYASLYTSPQPKEDFSTLSYQMLGERALNLGHYGQAVENFGKAIALSPTNPMPYLQRSDSYFQLEDYDRSLADFDQFITQVEQIPKTIPFSLPEFTIGLARGVPKGAYKAAKDLSLFFCDFVKHPIQTSTQVVQSISILVDLAKSNEWGLIADCLVPEARQLIKEWDTLPWDVRGERAGAILTEYGGDLLIPGASVKLAKKGVKGAQKLTQAVKGFKMAKETLLLETAAEIGNSAKVGEIVNSGTKTLFLGDELGFTAKEMGQLKQTGKLETTVTEAYEHLSLPMQESIKLFDKAQEFLKPYREFMSETKCRELIHKTGIQTFPRPAGIPQNFRVRISDKGAGLIYMHPEHTHTSIRVMPGKPHSPLPYQQKPYVIHMKDGKALDKFGNKLSNKELPEAHIPYDEFVYGG